MLGLISLVYVSLVLWLWIKADWLADLMEGGIPEPASAGEERYFDPDNLARVGVSLIGVYVFSEAFPKATQAITLVAFQNRLGDTPHYGSSLAASWVSLGVPLVLGLWLMFSAMLGGSCALFNGHERPALSKAHRTEGRISPVAQA